jgi:hypothetical protein
MNDLLQVAVNAPGRLERWNQIEDSEGGCGRTFMSGRPLGSWPETGLEEISSSPSAELHGIPLLPNSRQKRGTDVSGFSSVKAARRGR